MYKLIYSDNGYIFNRDQNFKRSDYKRKEDIMSGLNVNTLNWIMQKYNRNTMQNTNGIEPTVMHCRWETKNNFDVYTVMTKQEVDLVLKGVGLK